MAKPRTKELQCTPSSEQSGSRAATMHDPYRELELYLEKVHEEIGAVFEQWSQPVHKDLAEDAKPHDLAVVAAVPGQSYPDVVHQGEEQVQRRRATSGRPVLPALTETNHLAEFERVVAEELMTLTPSPSDSSGPSTPSPCLGISQSTATDSHSLPPRPLPDLLVARQQNGVTKTISEATSPVLEPLEVEQFLRKVHDTIMGEDVDGVSLGSDSVTRVSSGLDAGTQTQDLSRSSSFTWLSNSSLLDSPASAPSTSTEDTSSSSELLLATGRNNCTVKMPNHLLLQPTTPDPWLMRCVRNEQQCASNSALLSAATSSSGEWPRTARSDWQCSAPEIRNESSQEDASIDNEAGAQKKTMHPVGDEVCDAQHSPSLRSLRTVGTAGTPLTPEVATKSSSAPVLVKHDNNVAAIDQAAASHGDGHSKGRSGVPKRAQSERHLRELEAAEACRWMRAAGFPQYAQMYEDMQFPLDLNGVAKDHPFLDHDALQALFRRLRVLNKCSLLRVDTAGSLAKKGADDSDEEVECALSDNWTFMHQSRRWSRISPLTETSHARLSQDLQSNDDACSRATCSISTDETSLGLPDEDMNMMSDTAENTADSEQSGRDSNSLPPGNFRTSAASDSEITSPHTLRRFGSEKFRDGAKAILRRVESLKSRGKKQKPCVTKDDQLFIGSPQIIDVNSMEERMRNLNCIDVKSDPDSGIADDPSACQILNVPPAPRERAPRLSRAMHISSEDITHLTEADLLLLDREWQLGQQDESSSKDITESRSLSRGEPRRRSSKQQKAPQLQHAATLDFIRHKTKPTPRQGKSYSGELTAEPCNRELVKTNTFDEITKRELIRARKMSPRGFSDFTFDDDNTASNVKQRCVNRWHSFNRGNKGLSKTDVATAAEPFKVTLTTLSCGQLMVLKQLAMLKLTALMEKHCPNLRSTGFSWELPKFMKKHKTSHNKEQSIFGVSLLASLQQTGHALPLPIQAAMNHLSEHAIDRVGIFRKPGVRSRIQKLRVQLMNTGMDQTLELSLEEQQAYDVADVIKQFFRELPEALLTSKLSDTLLAIFQHVPITLRHEALKWALLLLPDQHREVLQCLLAFLNQIASHAKQNQMTTSNLSVCLAPSLFHSNLSASSTDSLDSQYSTSPRSRGKRRTKSTSSGSPDTKELTDSKAAHDCLLYMINNNDELFTISQDLLMQCHFSSMEQSIPVAFSELGADMGQDWKGYVQTCTTALLKEARERQRGWVSVGSPDSHVELAYKKVGDGHPLKIWRVSTEVEAPPAELLHRILWEQNLWDPSLIKRSVLAKPDQQSEVYHYVTASMIPLPPRDYCVLRSWRSDLPRGGCVLVETSVEYPGSHELDPGAVRAIVLASRYLLEPCGSGRTKLLHMSRVDAKGRSVEWYNKTFGHSCALALTRIRASFAHSTEGPESKV